MTRFQDAAEGKCLVHGTVMVRTVSRDMTGLLAREFLSCPLCNTEVVDRWGKEPGVIAISSADIKLPPPTPQQRADAALRESILTGNTEPLVREIIRLAVIEPLVRALSSRTGPFAGMPELTQRGGLADRLLRSARRVP